MYIRHLLIEPRRKIQVIIMSLQIFTNHETATLNKKISFYYAGAARCSMISGSRKYLTALFHFLPDMSESTK